MRITKMTSKGQVTIPVDIREVLGLDERSHLEVEREGQEVRLRKVVRARPLGDDDPFLNLVGRGASGVADTAESHDRARADLEISGWDESS